MYRNSLINADDVRDTVPCPRCGVRAGEPCKGKDHGNHADRVRAARQQRVIRRKAQG